MNTGDVGDRAQQPNWEDEDFHAGTGATEEPALLAIGEPAERSLRRAARLLTTTAQPSVAAPVPDSLSDDADRHAHEEAQELLVKLNARERGDGASTTEAFATAASAMNAAVQTMDGEVGALEVESARLDWTGRRKRRGGYTPGNGTIPLGR